MREEDDTPQRKNGWAHQRYTRSKTLSRRLTVSAPDELHKCWLCDGHFHAPLGGDVFSMYSRCQCQQSHHSFVRVRGLSCEFRQRPNRSEWRSDLIFSVGICEKKFADERLEKVAHLLFIHVFWHGQLPLVPGTISWRTGLALTHQLDDRQFPGSLLNDTSSPRQAFDYSAGGHGLARPISLAIQFPFIQIKHFINQTCYRQFDAPEGGRMRLLLLAAQQLYTSSEAVQMAAPLEGTR